MSDTSGLNTSADAVGMTMGAVPARAAAERVLGTADCKPPFPRELTVGFPGESKAPTAALMVPATGVAIGVLLVVASVMENRGGDKEARFPDGLGAILRVEGAVSVCIFLLVLVARALGGGALP
jgi:hypothetical protein